MRTPSLSGNPVPPPLS